MPQPSSRSEARPADALRPMGDQRCPEHGWTTPLVPAGRAGVARTAVDGAARFGVALTRPDRLYSSKMLPSSSMMPIWGTRTFRWPGLPERMILRRATLSSVDDSTSLPFGLPLTSM